ncbi:MAG: DEAD/DEAH box helicase [Minisyncoccia bacterium]|jgi:superfamily II DNA/RNA helicase
MYQKRFRNAGPSGPQRQFHYRGKPGRKDGGFRGGAGRRSPGGGFARHIDVSKFINKATITEKTAHFVPEHSFTDFQIDNRLKTNIASKGYFVPTPIQDKTIPHILRGADLVGLANTGTGKTAAFLIPLINKVLLSPKEKVLIVVPTRELALQIESEFKGFSAHMNLHAVSCVGGASIVLQMKWLSKPTQFIIGTPGRLKDLMERGKIDLSKFATVVLDEADRMLDMGFIGDVKFMLSKMPACRHTLFFAATTSREVDNLIKVFLKDPVVISVKTGDTAEQVEQDVVRVPVGQNKFEILCALLRNPEFDKVLIFGKTKYGVERLARNLCAAGHVAESIHGNKNQNQRVKALRLFTDHHVKILCATDVAARGLDISGVSHVINYDTPATYEDYVHRIGRTGRAGKKGKALTFV